MSAPAARTRKMETHSPEHPLLRAIRFRVCRKAGVRVRVRVRFRRRAGAGPFLSNSSLLYHYTSLYISRCKPRSTDLILRHLTVANSLVILSGGVPETMAALGLKYFNNYYACSIFLYVHRVARGMSIYSTCLLNVLQAIMIHPGNSRWAELKVKVPKYIGPSSILCWVLHMVVNMFFPIYMTGKWRNKNITKKRALGYCSASQYRAKITDLVYVIVTSFHNILCLGLMTLASSSMVFLLHRHRQRVQHIDRNKLPLRPSPESRATQSILVLVSTFVSFYSLSSIIYVYLALSDEYSWWLMTTAVLITAGFPTVSPFFLMSQDPSTSRLYCVCFGRNT
ncbi:vomeronasal type-1 receptor 2-like [Canis lupus baileyi]|nr:vomeronasal type-1 receptor 2-like isoform X1 [Canis lupus familiaris]XP_038509577.1 vomeronasal type-1 receptor 2-like isoform X1 [Canis lupus familiaris]